MRIFSSYIIVFDSDIQRVSRSDSHGIGSTSCASKSQDIVKISDFQEIDSLFRNVKVKRVERCASKSQDIVKLKIIITIPMKIISKCSHLKPEVRIPMRSSILSLGFLSLYHRKSAGRYFVSFSPTKLSHIKEIGVFDKKIHTGLFPGTKMINIASIPNRKALLSSPLCRRLKRPWRKSGLMYIIIDKNCKLD